jgi:hypothetical protein
VGTGCPEDIKETCRGKVTQTSSVATARGGPKPPSFGISSRRFPGR